MNALPIPSLYILGSDTEVGKTFFFCELLVQIQARRIRACPFKPAQSGADPQEGRDSDRIAQASDLVSSQHPKIAAMSFDAAVAPGCAESGAAGFIRHTPKPDSSPLQRARQQLLDLCDETDAQVAISEGAGGIHVPMPGGTWQLDWVRALADRVIVVARSGLGTINHSLLTLDALATRQIPVAAIAFCNPEHISLDFVHDNIAIIQNRCPTPCIAKPNQEGGLDFDPRIVDEIFVSSISRKT